MKVIGKIDHPNNEPIDDLLYRLEENYDFVFSFKGEEYLLRAKKGFVYDGASVPRWAWSISGLRPDGLLRAGALIHDLFYVYKGILDETCKYVEVYKGIEKVNLTLTRKEADQLFKKIILKSGVNKIRANLAYISIRIGGGRLWKKPRTHE